MTEKKKKEKKEESEVAEVDQAPELSDAQKKVIFEETIATCKEKLDESKTFLSQFPIKFVTIAVLPNNEILASVGPGIDAIYLKGLLSEANEKVKGA